MGKKLKQAANKTKRHRARKTSKRKAPDKKGSVSTEHRSRQTISKEPERRKGKESKAHEKAEAAYRRYGNGILDKLGPYGVTGVSVGPRFKNGAPTNEMTIRLHVATNEAKCYLKEHATEIGFKKTYGGVGTDILVWDFKTGSNGATSSGSNLGGSCIVGGGGPGTLGTKVIVISGSRRARWLTAAHVASRTIAPPPGPMPITRCDNGRQIGAVSTNEYVRNDLVDVAFITPDRTLSTRTTTRAFVRIKKRDNGAIVTMQGAVTPRGVQGKIIQLNYTGTISSPDGPEEVINHFLVEGINAQSFATFGDSGAIVYKGRLLIGMVRAATDTGVAVVTRLTAVDANAMRFLL